MEKLAVIHWHLPRYCYWQDLYRYLIYLAKLMQVSVVYKKWVLKQEDGGDRALASRMRTRTLHTVSYRFDCFSFSSYYDMNKPLFISHIHLLASNHNVLSPLSICNVLKDIRIIICASAHRRGRAAAHTLTALWLNYATSVSNRAIDIIYCTIYRHQLCALSLKRAYFPRQFWLRYHSERWHLSTY